MNDPAAFNETDSIRRFFLFLQNFPQCTVPNDHKINEQTGIEVNLDLLCNYCRVAGAGGATANTIGFSAVFAGVRSNPFSEYMHTQNLTLGHFPYLRICCSR